ncbi:glycosyltransferase [Brachybacterium sp. AOP43-C2-M15]|uniref:glycosyltransferase n=1 Tax=Brachybacterium sp. AOP43-C2-M15 TaxID=3457661 RepID=UPI0040348BA3
MTPASGTNRWKRRVERALGRTPVRPETPTPDPEVPARDPELMKLPEGARALLRAARAHAETAATTADEKLAEKSLGEFREAVAASRCDPMPLRDLADFLEARGEGPAAAAIGALLESAGDGDLEVPALRDRANALEARGDRPGAEALLALVLAADASQVEDVDRYLDLVGGLALPRKRINWALKRLRADAGAGAAPGQHRAAAHYAIAHGYTELLARIGESPDPVARAIVRINAAADSGEPDGAALEAIRADLALTSADLRSAHLEVMLARGNRSSAKALLAETEDSRVPAEAVRREIRRLITAGRKKKSLPYVNAYLRARPDDAWALSLRKQLTTAAPTNYQLGKTGFPLPKDRAEPVFEPVRNRVLYLLHNSLPHHSAGYATRTHGLLRELNDAGWDVDGVTRLGYPYDMPGKEDIPDVPEHEVIDGVDYLRLLTGRQIEKKNPLFNYVGRYSNELEKTARRDHPAIIHAASNHWNGLTGVSVARKLGLPSIYEIRGLWEITRGSRNPEWAASNMYKYIARMESDAAKGATRVFTITGALRDEMVRRGVEAEKITVLPNGVDTERFTPIPRDEELARELRVQGKTVIGYVGSILDYEGLGLLIDAAATLAAERDDFHVLLVGDGAELESFRDRVREDGLDRVITFTGRVPHEDVERYYSLVDITPFPRLPLPVCEMVSPLKPFEAMAMGKAVVASDVAALAEIVTPGANGLLHAKGEAGSLTAELRRLLDDPELVGRLGAQAREWVVQNRDWRQISTIVAETYAELAEGPRG